MSISKSQLDALNRGLLDRFGKQANDPTLNEGGLLGEILQNVTSKLIDVIREDITQKKVVATQNLRSEINPTNAVPISDGISISILMADYWQNVEDGRRSGKRPPIAPIEEWISRKGINLRRSSSDSAQTVLDRRRSLAYAIASKIAKRGTIKRFGYKGANFIKDVLTPQNIEAIAQHLGEMYGRKIELFVTVE